MKTDRRGLEETFRGKHMEERCRDEVQMEKHYWGRHKDSIKDESNVMKADRQWVKQSGRWEE